MNPLNDKRNLTLGIVSAICIVVIILGGFATYSIVKEFTTPSATYGKALIQHLAGDENDLELNEDESVFLSYTVKNLSFTKDAWTWSDIKSIEKLDYRPDECDYTLYINGRKIQANKLTRIIECPVSLNFRNPDDSVTNVEFELRFTFYTERTDIRILFHSDQYIGYVNQMANTGFNIRLIEKPISDTFGNAGNITNPSLPKNTFTYSFSPSGLQWDGDNNNLIRAPYYVYYKTTGYGTGLISASATHSEGSTEFYGVVFHDGFNGTTEHYPGGSTSDIYKVNPNIEINGLTKGGSYNAFIAFANGKTENLIMSYTTSDYNAYGVLTALAGWQSRQESMTYNIFNDTYQHAQNAESLHDWTLYNDGAFVQTIETPYGKYDMLINPSFATTDGSSWVFSCGIYLKNPLNTIMDNTVIASIVEAIKTQLAFSITISF